MQKIEDAVVRMMFIILKTRFSHFELPLCYFMFLFNLEKGHPAFTMPAAESQGQHRGQIVFTGKKKLAPETLHCCYLWIVLEK